VLQNPSKQPSFSLDQRLAQIRRATAHLTNVEVGSFDGLTVEFARRTGTGVILRGLRAMSDFEFELQIAHTNLSLAPEVETLFLATAVPHSFLQARVSLPCSEEPFSSVRAPQPWLTADARPVRRLCRRGSVRQPSPNRAHSRHPPPRPNLRLFWWVPVERVMISTLAAAETFRLWNSCRLEK
jgi:hypothetical protein